MIDRQKIHHKIRHTIVGTAERPRLAVYRSLNNLFAQLIDDDKHVTIVGLSSLKEKGSLTQKAEIVGRKIAEAAKTKKIKAVVLDRGGFPYQGVIKKLADEARKTGLEF